MAELKTDKADQWRAQLGNEMAFKGSRRYVATGGWGFGDFEDGKPSDEALHKACYSCHQPAKDRDFVFTGYASQGRSPSESRKNRIPNLPKGRTP